VTSASEFFCLIFDSLTDAESYCQKAVSQTRSLKCEIFDSAGRVNPPVAVLVNPEFVHKLDTEASARRLVRWGFVAIAISLPLFWYAWRNNAGVVWWPVFLGINSVFAGLRLIQWGHGLKEEPKIREIVIPPKNSVIPNAAESRQRSGGVEEPAFSPDAATKAWGAITTDIRQIVTNVFAPFFFASIGLRTNFAANFSLGVTLTLIAVACLGKILGASWGARLGGMDARSSWAVGLAMNARGAMEIILGVLALRAGLIGERRCLAKTAARFAMRRG
jgi:hypothetical protein